MEEIERSFRNVCDKVECTEDKAQSDSGEAGVI